MSHLLSCQSISKTFGAAPLFRGVSLGIAEGDRIGLIGPNGSGKSTLVQILAGIQEPDEGQVVSRKLLRSGYIPQEPVFPPGLSVFDVVAQALSSQPLDDFEKEILVTATLSRVGFSRMDEKPESLSGGWRKRLAVARELVRDPDVLLLDEPTNHLDLDGILWLESMLLSSSFASLIVSHDRYFLENVATTMVEINRIYPDGLLRVGGSYSEFLLRREEFLEAETKQREALKNVVRREVEWLRRGPKARTTKSKARIDTAGRMIDELAGMQSRAADRSTSIEFSASGRQTKRLLTTEGVSKELGGRTLFQDVKVVLQPGKRLGLVGPNGSGKTTLLRLFSREIAPDSGVVETADNLRVVYFDQHRQRLDMDVSLRRALAPEGDSVIYRDRPIHVAGWAKRFLFRSEQLDVAVHRLSGGERARVVIARLMLQQADLLLLDEPTNDLDIPTLEVLEESLLDFPGALVLVTHDRYMLDRVSTEVLGLDGAGGWGLFADYSQWEQDRSDRDRARTAKPIEKSPSASTAAPKAKKLSYKDAREWETMEARIHEAEAELAARQAALSDPGVTSDPQRLLDAYSAAQTAQNEIDRLFERWADLEAKQRPG